MSNTVFVITDVMISSDSCPAGYIPLSINGETNPEDSVQPPPMDICFGIGGHNVYIYVKYEAYDSSLNQRILVGIDIGDWGRNWNFPSSLKNQMPPWQTPSGHAQDSPPAALTPGTDGDCLRIGMAVRYSSSAEILASGPYAKHISRLSLTVTENKNGKDILTAARWVLPYGDIHAGCGDNNIFRIYYKEGSLHGLYLPWLTTKPNPSFEDGDLVMGPGSPKIYLTQNGMKWHIPNMATFQSQGYELGKVQSLTQQQLEGIDDYQAPFPDGVLLQAQNDTAIYLMIRGMKWHVPNPAAFSSLGLNPAAVRSVLKSDLDLVLPYISLKGIPSISDEHKVELMKQYSPFAYLAQGEQFLPSSVEFILENCNVANVGGNNWLITKKQLDHASAVLPYFDGDLPGAKVYAFWVEKSDGPEITYFYCFPYNRGKSDTLKVSDTIWGNHVSDWEHVTIRFSLGDGNKMVPQEVYGSAHENGNTRAWSAVSKTSEGRPIVYLASGSHAVYFAPGSYTYKFGVSPDVCSQGKPFDAADCLEFFDYDTNTNLANGHFWPSWMTTDYGDLGSGAILRWGNLKRGTEIFGVAQLENGPTGPIEKKHVWDYSAVEK